MPELLQNAKSNATSAPAHGSESFVHKRTVLLAHPGLPRLPALARENSKDCQIHFAYSAPCIYEWILSILSTIITNFWRSSSLHNLPAVGL